VEVASLQISIRVCKGHTLEPTVGSPSNLYTSFRTPFSLD
jgi:hypothetical protein